MGYLKQYFYPGAEEREEFVKRPSFNAESIEASVRTILMEVKEGKDEALFAFERKFGRFPVTKENIRVTPEEFAEAEKALSSDLKNAIRTASENIRKFHEAEVPSGERVEISGSDIVCSRRIVPIEKVGLYVPGGTAPLFSTVLMLAIPAKIAGCSEVIMCTPAGADGKINPAVLYAAKISGVKTIYKTGGAQAIAAMAYGTESIPRVYKIFGPGNRYVTAAKRLVASEAASIDMPAGPSEVLVVIKPGDSPAFAAADLLSQAEHGVDSQAMLVAVTENRDEGAALIEAVEKEIEKQLSKLPRGEYLKSSLSHSAAAVVRDENDASDIINAYAPEHLIILSGSGTLEEKITSAGSIFLGPYSPESAGDYASGTNHTLPTSGWAHSCSGVSVDSFIKKITVQRLSENGIRRLEPVISEMARAEGLEAHRNAARIRTGGDND